MGDAGALPKDGLLASEGNFVDGIIAALEEARRGLEIGGGDVEVYRDKEWGHDTRLGTAEHN